MSFQFAGLLAAAALAAAPALAARVEVVRRGAGYQLLRDGRPYFVRGAVAYQFFDRLAAAGANSIRSGPAGLDEAHRHGLTVLLNLPLGLPRAGFDYTDAAALARQREAVRAAVLKHKNHPALLVWALGNELSIRTTAEQRIPVWKEINHLARMIHQLDPDHPVAMPVGGAYKRELAEIREHCPDLDIIGLNSYRDMLTLPEDVERQGWTKPYVVTEFGPIGHWQVAKTAWGAPIEQTSSEKAAFYRQAYEHAIRGRPLCLGSYAFLWWQKMEKTHTWYGMLLPDGSRTEAVDAMQELWTGRPPANRAPRIGAMKMTVLMNDQVNAPGAPHRYPASGRIRAVVDAWDPDGDPLSIAWDLRRDVADDPRVGGDFEESVDPIPFAVSYTREKQATIELPAAPGKYRVFAYVRDGRGAAGTANLPVLVEAPIPAFPAPRPAADPSAFGSGIERTMALLAGSTPLHRRKVRILFYGQSITKQAWWWQVVDDLRRRFPHADLEAENLSLGGYSSPYLIRTTPQDVYAFHPDLVVFHVYGDETKYEEIIAGIRANTGAEILIQNDHPNWTGPGPARDARRRRSLEFLPSVAKRYGCGFVDILTPWEQYLADNSLEPKNLLRDGVHLNSHGNYLMAQLTARYFQHRPGGPVATGLVTAHPVGGELRWKANRLTFDFEGNRVDVLAAPGLAGLKARVLIDGRPPATWVHTRPTRAWGADWTAVNRVSSQAPLVEEDWRIEFTEMAPDASFFRFRAIGSKTGPDGEGNSRERFVSRSGRVVIEPEDWAIERAYKLAKEPMPEGFLVHWRSVPRFTAVYRSPEAIDLSREGIATLAEGLPNGKHRLELIAETGTAPEILELRVWRPR